MEIPPADGWIVAKYVGVDMRGQLHPPAVALASVELQTQPSPDYRTGYLPSGSGRKQSFAMPLSLLDTDRHVEGQEGDGNEGRRPPSPSALNCGIC